MLKLKGDFDILSETTAGFRMNGELSSSGAGGFQKIVIRDIAGNGTSLYTLEFSISDIIATDHAEGHDPMSTPWPGKEKEVTILRPGLTVDRYCAFTFFSYFTWLYFAEFFNVPISESQHQG